MLNLKKELRSVILQNSRYTYTGLKKSLTQAELTHLKEAFMFSFMAVQF